MDREARYWKCEYENLRRKKKKEIDRMKYQQAKASHASWDLLHLYGHMLGISDKEILEHYKRIYNG